MAIVRMFDGLRNLVSGLGGGADKAMGATYTLSVPDRMTIDACYRTTWLGRKIHDIPALDMTREWRGWQAKDDQIEAIENEEKRLQLQIKVRRAIVLARLYGGAALIMGLPGDAALPAPEKIGKGGLAYLHLVHRHQLTLGDQNRDLADPLFGRPQNFQLTAAADGRGSISIHPSRVVCLTGNQLPDGSSNAGADDWFWGDPLLAAVFDALTSHDTGIAAIANLLNEAKTDIVHVPGLMDSLAVPEYERILIERFNIAALLKSVTNVLILDGGDGTADTGEKWDQRQITWTGLPEVQQTLFQLVTGASDIPATRLMGMSPSGMNATGESDTRNYYDMLSSLQNSDITPVLAPLDEYLIMSATGARDPSIFYDWEPLWQMSPKEKAERDKLVSETANTYANMGVVPDDAFAVSVQNRLVEDGVFPGLEAALEEAQQQAKLEIPPEERVGVAPPANGPPQSANDPNPPAPGKAAVATQGAGRGSAVQKLAGNNSRRKAANDRARRYVSDRAGLSTLDLTFDHLLDPSEVGALRDFNPAHVAHGANGGQFTRKGSGPSVVFEIAPDPDNKELTALWEALSDEERASITAQMTSEFMPKIGRAMGVNGSIENAVGGFEGHVNPSRLFNVGDRQFEVAGVIGHVFDQKSMVVMSRTAAAGLDPVGAIAIKLPGATVGQLRALQAKLPLAADGWTYHNGHMTMLNFTGETNASVAAAVDKTLGGRYEVIHETVYSALVERSNYVSPQSDARGNTWQPVGDSLREQFARSFAAKVAGSQTGDAQGQAQGQVGDFNPNHVQTGQHGGEFTRKGSGAGAVAALTEEAKAAMVLANIEKDIEQLRSEAAVNQAKLEALGAKVARSVAVEFHGPPPDSAIKTAESIARKVHDEHYAGPGELRDISRAMFVVDNPGQVDKALNAMSASGAKIYNRGWVKQKSSGYLGAYAYMQHPNGGVSEIQFVGRDMLQARNTVGHGLYKIMRDPLQPAAAREAAAASSKELYGAAVTKPFKSIYG